MRQLLPERAQAEGDVIAPVDDPAERVPPIRQRRYVAAVRNPRDAGIGIECVHNHRGVLFMVLTAIPLRH
jgi:hypothetical protein